MTVASELIQFEKRTNKVAVLTLNNPPLNVTTLEATKQLRSILQEIEADDEVRVVILTGAGEKAFCAGSDINEFPSVRDDVIGKKLRKENEAFNAIEALPKPVIAAINGVACGGGGEIALACDIRIIAETSRIGFPEVNLGVFPGSGGLFRLPQVVGEAKALELMYFGDLIDAKEAYRIGLVNEVVPDDDVFDYALRLAERLAQKPKASLKAIKQGVKRSARLTVAENTELTLELSDRVFQTRDCEEGVKAFFEKREPRFE
ncbi:enoyl-CoA hydratase/isomerase family protein [Halalkalibacter oceani]|uniref:Enoyl-CoA hydratase n=1 Tax=Halalkalibacter oceani TaxID=1653776 RepID=A0A9X2DMR2_9BACI|nr:enoyl-CoA hydratase [Halalkalibacter oceani]MCM3713489.1 enoyl-CoA hydratase [Halalkalibacter oceani]